MSDELADLAVSFTRHLRAENRAMNTAKVYLEALTSYRKWLAERGRPRVLAEVTRVGILAWLAFLADTVQPGTVQIRWQGMRRFTGWLVDEGLLAELPMRGLSKPEVPDKPVPILSDDDLIALLKACQGKSFIDRRDEAIVRFLLDCGVRVAELCGQAVDDIDLASECSLVTGKGGKKRMVYFGIRTARALDRYKRLRAQHRWGHLDAFWLGERGAMTPDGVRYRMEVRAAAAGLVDPANPHRFRHTFAHDFLISGGQERDLKRLAGWSSDVMLEKYGRSAADMRAAAAAKKLRRGDRV